MDNLMWDSNDTTGAAVGHPDRTEVKQGKNACPVVTQDSFGFLCTANKDHKGPHVAGDGDHVVEVWNG